MRRLKLSVIAETALIIAILALGKPVLVPIALAFYFAFVLTPPAEAIERFGVPRSLSLMLVVGAAVATFATLGSVLVSQIAELAQQMQTYSHQMSEKVATLRQGGLGLLGHLGEAGSQLMQAVNAEASGANHSSAVRLVYADRSPLQQLEDAVRPVLEPAAMAGVVLVLTIFVLALREDLRGRLIQLLGPQNVTVTTRTMSEVVNRISHYLLTQAYINASFGTVIALGLWVIGLPYALLWGAIAGLLRFVPLLGAILAVLLPSLISFAIFPGWHETLMTVLLFIAVDIIVANFIEPLVMGKRTGVSSLALLISTLFWTWLWGPLGLVLATPLTVCAAVIGRHVPQLSFLAIALGDEPGLKPELDFYQRLLAGAKTDALRLATQLAAKGKLIEAFDVAVRPALALMARDHSQHTIDAEAVELMVADGRDIVARLTARFRAGRTPLPASVMLGVPAESTADAMLLEMLSAVMPNSFTQVPVLERAALVDEVVRQRPRLVCVSALPPGANVNARFVCRRLRAQLPEAHLVVLLPAELEGHAAEVAARLREAGANQVAFTLGEAAAAVAQWRSTAGV